jgi:hypothetical protein
MGLVIDLGVPWELLKPLNVAEIGQAEEIVLRPPHPVAWIAPHSVCFRIRKIRVGGVMEVAEYSFDGFFALGMWDDFCGEYTLRLVVRPPDGNCGVLNVAEMSFSAFERDLAIELGRDLASSLPENLRVYGAGHGREWLVEKWMKATAETVFVI